MKRNYKEIEFGGGTNIESAVKKLTEYKEQGENAFGVFNGHKLFSDIDDIDSAYMKIVGKTKAEFDADEAKRIEETRGTRTQAQRINSRINRRVDCKRERYS